MEIHRNYKFKIYPTKDRNYKFKIYPTKDKIDLLENNFFSSNQATRWTDSHLKVFNKKSNFYFTNLFQKIQNLMGE